MKQKAAEELVQRESHDALAVAMGGVSPAEADVAVSKSNQPAIRDGDTMGVGTEITEDVFGAAERRLGVDDPVVAEQRTEPGGKSLRRGQRCKLAMKLERAFAKSPVERRHELTAKDSAEDFLREEEAVVRGDPAGVIGSEAASGYDAVDMGMMLQSLVPGVEHAEEADLGAEVTRVAGDLEQGFATGAKQKVVEQAFVLRASGARSRGRVKTTWT